MFAQGNSQQSKLSTTIAFVHVVQKLGRTSMVICVHALIVRLWHQHTTNKLWRFEFKPFVERETQARNTTKANNKQAANPSVQDAQR